MNVKIAEKSVTFKITEKELGGLLKNGHLEETVSIAGNNFAMAIDSSEKSENLSCELILHPLGSGLALHAPHASIRKLAEMGRNREGLSASWKGLEIVLQVDIRADGRSKVKR